MALAKANRLESLYKHSTPSVHTAHSEVRTVRPKGGPTDRPTDQQKEFRKYAEWFRSMLSPCQKKSHSHDMQNKAVQNFPKQVQVLPLPAGNLGSHIKLRWRQSESTSENRVLSERTGHASKVLLKLREFVGLGTLERRILLR